MPSRATVLRAAAVIILLLTGVELFACELFSPSTCEIWGAPSDDGSSKSSGGDNCLCCCFHIVVSPRIDLIPAVDAAPAYALSFCEPPSTDSPRIYHPPRA